MSKLIGAVRCLHSTATTLLLQLQKKGGKKEGGEGGAVILQGQNQLYSDTTEFHLCLFALFLLVWLFP